MNPLAALPNPFEGNVVLDAWTPAAVDVASIHKHAFEQCLLALDSASRGRPDSVLIVGGAGSGKTHVLARLQHHLVATANTAPDGVLRCVFVSARLQTNALMLWQLIRRRLASDLLRKQQGLTQLQRLVAHQVAEARGESPRRSVMELRVLTGADESISEHLAEVAQRLELGRDLCVALDHLVHSRFLGDAAAWLRGDSLPESALERLGLGREEHEDREEAARRVVTDLCRLAGETLPIVFCFDQIEALQSHPDDRESLFRFGRAAADLADADPNVLLISCIQTSFHDLLDVSVRDADRARIFKRHAPLAQLTREQVDALVLQRLDSVEDLRKLRAQQRGARFHPFDERFMARLRAASPCTPRKVIALAAAELEQLQRGRPPAPQDVGAFLGDAFAARRAAALERGRPEESQDTLTHGLPMLWALGGRGPAGDRPPAGADLLLPASPEPLLVSVRNETNMTSLAARLRQLAPLADGKAKAAGRVVILRDVRLGITRTAKRTQEYLADLEKRGARLVQPSIEALAALEALRSLLSDARAGDLAASGDVVGELTVRDWLAAHLDEDLRELVEDLAGRGAAPPAPPEARLLRDLGDLMLRSFVARLDELAPALGCSPEEVLALAQQHADRFGVLHGPPVVLFAHVPAESLAETAG
ncbi:AAA family ATPase [Sorangium sp. So ce1078]|uniref:AAA family ATPase n=1 Tax=Sorangium sp. So ce1078 TaxID=3133329 RepID=UPI003F6475AC